jgi:hypothetical protein
MKRLEKILLRASAYTVLIFTAFCLFSGALAMHTPAIEIKKFFLILLFGVICAITENLTDTKRLNAFLRTLIRYAVSLTAFCLFLMPNAASISSGADVFIAVAIFTLVFAMITAMLFVLRIGLASLEKKSKKDNSGGTKPEKAKYTPRYKD